MDRLLVMNSSLWRPSSGGGGGGPTTQTVALTAGTVTNGTLVGSSLVAAMGDGLDTTYVQSGAGSSSGVPYADSDIAGIQFASPSSLSDVASFVANIKCSVSTGTALVQLQLSSGLSGASSSAVNTTATTSIQTLQTPPITKSSGTWTPAQLAAATFEVIATVSGSAPDIFIYEISLTATQ